MGKVVNKLVNGINKTIFGKDSQGDADAIRQAAETQAAAQEAAANKAATVAREAAAQQAQQSRDQAAAATAAQTNAINQNQQAANLAAQAQASQAELGSNTPDVTVTGPADSSDPRRKYQGGQSSIGGTSGGVGIRI